MVHLITLIKYAKICSRNLIVNHQEQVPWKIKLSQINHLLNMNKNKINLVLTKRQEYHQMLIVKMYNKWIFKIK